MSEATQTTYGKAYEYACLLSLGSLIGPIRKTNIIENSSVAVAQNAWQAIDNCLQKSMLTSALAGVKTVIELEPKIIQDGQDILEITLQPDSAGKSGDVRDVLIIRRNIFWEIGISVKHNNDAVKHSRISPSIDFGKEWFGLACSKDYFEEITPIFNSINTFKQVGMKWGQVSDKDSTIYVPLLIAFMNEVRRLDNSNPGIVPTRLLEYLLGRKDFYKLISNDTEKTTTVQCFNLHGTLNTASVDKKPSIKIKGVIMPSRILYLGFKNKQVGVESTTTIQITMDNDWGVSMRLHSAKSAVENSLKFDIKLTGVPTSLFVNKAMWQ